MRSMLTDQPNSAVNRQHGDSNKAVRQGDLLDLVAEDLFDLLAQRIEGGLLLLLLLRQIARSSSHGS